jgi:hypothetical protein
MNAAHLMKMKIARTNIEWVAQVSLLRPGCFGQDPFFRRNPGLKSETWATHSRSGGLFFLQSVERELP